MINFSFFLCLSLSLGIWVGPRSAEAGQPATQKKAQAEVQTAEKPETGPNPKPLGPWWQFSSLKSEPMVPKWLFHWAGNLAYMRFDGNIQGWDYSGGLNFALRKSRYTTHLTYSLDKGKTSLSVGGASVETDKQSLLGREQIDLSRHLAINIGANWEKDSAFFVKDRYTYYAGLSYIALDLPGHFARIGGFYGYDRTQYDNQNLRGYGLPSAGELKSDGMLLEQYYRLMFTPRIFLSEAFEYMKES